MKGLDNIVDEKNSAEHETRSPLHEE